MVSWQLRTSVQDCVSTFLNTILLNIFIETKGHLALKKNPAIFPQDIRTLQLCLWRHQNYVFFVLKLTRL